MGMWLGWVAFSISTKAANEMISLIGMSEIQKRLQERPFPQIRKCSIPQLASLGDKYNQKSRDGQQGETQRQMRKNLLTILCWYLVGSTSFRYAHLASAAATLSGLGGPLVAPAMSTVIITYMGRLTTGYFMKEEF